MRAYVAKPVDKVSLKLDHFVWKNQSLAFLSNKDNASKGEERWPKN